MLIKDKEELNYLEETLNELKRQIDEYGHKIFSDKEKLKEYQRNIWETKQELDKGEWLEFFKENSAKIEYLDKASLKLARLTVAKNQPYFGSFIFNDEKFYIGIMAIKKDLNYYVLDWRAPISSLFYDYTLGKCQYKSPEGIISGNMTQKRQYKIEKGKLVHIFDTEINIDDDILQDVLAQNSSDKMKNIVTTIQSEQNAIIRNMTYKTILVQGIAGSGKTSVALHRIAFLLYQMPNLTSKNVLIFSPNHVFSEYISDVLPTLGEENTEETVYSEFIQKILDDYQFVESYASFVGRFYKGKNKDNDLIMYKMSDAFATDLEKYISYLSTAAQFTDSIVYKKKQILKKELNELFHKRYQDKPIFERVNLIAEKINNKYFKGLNYDYERLKKKLLKNTNFCFDTIKIYNSFFSSKLFMEKYPNLVGKFLVNESDVINYEDATPLAYLKCLLEGYPYEVHVRHVIIDEAQDYTKLQYKLMVKIFKNANFTILGDVHQNVNPFYKHDSISSLLPIFTDAKFMELTKSYRSSPEIISEANKVLNLDYVSAIRNSSNVPVIRKSIKDLKYIGKDIKYLKDKYQSVAVITKTNEEAKILADSLKTKYSKTSLIDDLTKTFNKELLIAPAYGVKGLEFDSVIIVNNFSEDLNLYYVAITRAQHELIIYE